MWAGGVSLRVAPVCTPDPFSAALGSPGPGEAGLEPGGERTARGKGTWVQGHLQAGVSPPRPVGCVGSRLPEGLCLAAGGALAASFCAAVRCGAVRCSACARGQQGSSWGRQTASKEEAWLAGVSEPLKCC